MILLLPPEWFAKWLELPLAATIVLWALLQIAVLLAVVLTADAYLTYLERKVSAWIQVRLGPNRVGPWGLLQPLADGIKLLLKEDIIPAAADRRVFTIAPVISLACALVMLAVIPWGARWAGMTDIDIGLLFILSVSSVGVLGVILGGWSSSSKYALMGALRSSAQMVSYEVAMGLAVIGSLLYTRTLSMQGAVEAQQQLGLWLVFLQPVGFMVYFVSSLAETNRAPFDLPEAESELVAGFHTEYSGFRFSVFFIAEYTNMIVVSAVAVTLFLGGWNMPGLAWLESISETLFVVASVLVFATKTAVLIYIFLWCRWTFPRYRYDQLMELGWKWMIPAALANIIVSSVIFTLGGEFGLIVLQNGSLRMQGVAGYGYFLGASLLVGLPAVLIILSFINRRSRDFNLRGGHTLPDPGEVVR